jgi:hypothetical protein
MRTMVIGLLGSCAVLYGSEAHTQTLSSQACMAAAVREVPQGVPITDVRVSDQSFRTLTSEAAGIVEIDVRAGSLQTTLQFSCVLAEDKKTIKIQELEAAR